ncbi:MAG: M23 family metallopeptidase [Bacteroidales bacterium]|nr:M23 family metallopeptidase [Candidatus Colimorpha onthohippi]
MTRRWPELQHFWQPFKDVFHNKHRFVVVDTHTLKEKFSFQLSGLNVFITVGISVILLVVVTFLLIAFTSLRELIPGYANLEMVEQTYRNAAVIDSLEVKVRQQEWMLVNIKDVLSGKQMPSAKEAEAWSDSVAALGVSASQYSRSRADSLLRLYVEEQDPSAKRCLSQPKNISQHESKSPVVVGGVGSRGGAKLYALSNLLTVPLRGRVISSFNESLRHFGCDLSVMKGCEVVSIYIGTVVFADFVSGLGNVLVIQHPGNMMSVYAHCSSLLKRQGDRVRMAEPIAMVGVPASLSTSESNLHFELWIDGKAVDPNQYFVF